MKKYLSILCAVLCAVFIASALSGCTKILESELSNKLVQGIASTSANFKKSVRIIVNVEPADLDLYREILPGQFDMPEHPIVTVIMIDQTDVGPWPLTPYQEGCLQLLCSYEGEQGWYITKLPVSTWVAKYAGRTMGYPKYVADKVTFEQTGDGYISEVFHKGEKLIGLEYVPDEWEYEPRWSKEEWDMGGPVFNLMPPGEGPDVKKVGSSSEDQPDYESRKGMVKIFIGQDEPWAGLIPEGTVAPGVLLRIDEVRSLVPEDKD